MRPIISLLYVPLLSFRLQMPHAKTVWQATRDHRREKEAAVQRALAVYIEGLKLPKPPSLRQVAEKFGVNRQTLQNRFRGVQSLADFNAEKSHLSDAESKILIDVIIRQAQRGFPLTNRMIEDHANHILRTVAKPGYGPDFRGVGINWCSNWLKKWDSHVSSYWSTSLETVRANALTPENVKDWFKLYHETIQLEEITPERTFQMDEVGFMLGIGRKEKVVGAKGVRVQHTQRSGNRELITLLSTICGDGTALTPTVIFKGKNLLHCWIENNPLGCS